MKHLNAKEIGALRQDLEKRATELVEQISDQRHDAAESGGVESGGSDRGEESRHELDITLALSQAELGSHELEDIRQALQAIEKGQFGICIDCDQPIPRARLTVNPAATRCIDCQETAEQDFDERDATPSL